MGNQPEVVEDDLCGVKLVARVQDSTGNHGCFGEARGFPPVIIHREQNIFFVCSARKKILIQIYCLHTLLNT